MALLRLLATFDPSSFEESENSPQLLDLQFFKEFNTIEMQQALRKAIRDLLLQYIVEDDGKQWVPLYIAYTFAINKRCMLNGYVFFFSDIEALLPGLLKNISSDQESGYRRYESLAKSLSRGCQFWFVDDGFLPPPEEWTSSKYVYQVEDVERRQVHRLANNLLSLFYKLFKLLT